MSVRKGLFYVAGTAFLLASIISGAAALVPGPDTGSYNWAPMIASLHKGELVTEISETGAQTCYTFQDVLVYQSVRGAYKVLATDKDGDEHNINLDRHSGQAGWPSDRIAHGCAPSVPMG